MIDAADLGALPDAPTTRAGRLRRCCRGGRPRRAAVPARRHLCRVEPHAAEASAAIGVPGATRIVYGGDGHLLMAEDADAYRTDRAGHRRRATAGSPTRREASSIFAASNTSVDRQLRDRRQRQTRHRLSSAWAAASNARRSPARPMPASIPSRRPGLPITGNTVSDCADGGILVHRWQRATTARSSPATASSGSAPRAAAPASTATASTSSAPTT